MCGLSVVVYGSLRINRCNYFERCLFIPEKGPFTCHQAFFLSLVTLILSPTAFAFFKIWTLGLSSKDLSLSLFLAPSWPAVRSCAAALLLASHQSFFSGFREVNLFKINVATSLERSSSSSSVSGPPLTTAFQPIWGGSEGKKVCSPSANFQNK